VRSARSTRRGGLGLAALLLIILAAGCTTRGSSGPTVVPDDVIVHVVIVPWQSQLGWFVTVHDNATKSYDVVQVSYSVEKRGGIPDGQGKAETSVAPGKDGTTRFATPDLGIGDYIYDITASSPTDGEIGALHGVYENCVC